MRLEFDNRGRLMESVVPISESGGEPVIHAMSARKQFPEPLPWISETAAVIGVPLTVGHGCGGLPKAIGEAVYCPGHEDAATHHG